MRGNIPFFAGERFQHFKVAVLLCLLCSLVMDACGSELPVPTSTMEIPAPTINVPNDRCELAPGESLPLAVTGVSGDGIVYSWTASAGSVTPPDSPVVNFTAPNTGGYVIIRIEARKDGQSSDAVITCVISTSVTLTPTSAPTLTATPTAIPTETLTPTITPTPTPTPIPYATYEICDYGDGNVKVTLNPPEDEGEYTYSRSKIFEAQRGDWKEVVVKSVGDGRVWATIIHIEIDKVYPNCSSAPSLPDKPDENGDGEGDGEGGGGGEVIPPAPY